MKKENNFRDLLKASRLMLVLVMALCLADLSACSKSGNTGAMKGDEATSDQSAVTRGIDVPQVEVDELPLFPGGDVALLKYVAENTVYPEDAKKNNITGKVIVKYVVRKDCTVTDAEIIKSVSPSIDEAAIRVVESLPKYEKPAMKGGKPVSVYLMLPITFALK
jgi:protein TonB